jgi:hypothetical protein
VVEWLGEQAGEELELGGGGVGLCRREGRGLLYARVSVERWFDDHVGVRGFDMDA